MRDRFRLLVIMLCLILAACDAGQKQEQGSAEEFYRGKTITIFVGFTPGGRYDLLARALAQHMPAYIPGNPNIIVQNMPGAGSLLAANHMFNIAPKDGTAFGSFISSMPLAPLWKIKEARYDPVGIQWLGSLADNGDSVLFVRSDAPATTIQEAMVKTDLLGSTGPASTTATIPRLLNDMLGTKFKVVFGYPGGKETLLALERGEVHGRADNDWGTLSREYPDWVEKKFIVPLVQLTLEPSPRLPHVPLALDMVKDEKDKAVMRLILNGARYMHAFAMAPEVPKERVAIIRKAFEEVAKDEKFRSDAENALSQPTSFVPGEEIATFVRDAYALPPDIKDRAARYATTQ